MNEKGKTHSLTLSIPVDTHERLGILSALLHKSKTQIIIELIDEQKVHIPNHIINPGEASTQKRMEASTHERMKSPRAKRKKKYDPALKEKILSLEAEGLGLSEICEKLESGGFTTSTGLHTWHKNTVRRMLNAFEEEPG
jgi:hypothetical protein